MFMVPGAVSSGSPGFPGAPGDTSWVFETLLAELNRTGGDYEWPLYFVVWIPRSAPRKWQALVASRVVSTLGPQLDAAGFLCRPLCMDDPFIFLLWPQDSTWSPWSTAEYILPLRARVSEVLFHMLYEAHQLMWPGEASAGVPTLSDLLPDITVCRCMPC